MQIICKSAILLIALINFIAPLAAVDLAVPLFCLGCTALMIALPRMGAAFKKVTLIFLAAGAGLFVYSGQPFSAWVAGINLLTNVIAILVVMQLFTIPIEAGNYSAVVRYWLNRSFRSETGLFVFATIATHLFSSFLLFGTVPVMVALLSEPLKNTVADYRRFIATVVARGYALVVLWAPGTVNLFLIIQATGVSWSSLFVPGLILAITGIVTSCLLEAKTRLSKAPLVASPPDGETTVGLTLKEARCKAGHILLVVLGLAGLIVIFEKMHLGSASNRIIYAGGIVVLGWLTQVIRQKKFPTVVADYWRSGMPKTIDLTALFLSMGLFANAVERSGALALIQLPAQHYLNAVGLFALVIVPVLMILLAVAGLHPYISIVMFGHILTRLNLPVPLESLALSLALGGSVSYILSPFGGIVLALAKFLDCKVTDIAFRWNRAFCVIFLLEGVLFIYLWGKTSSSFLKASW